ncbi:MAG TPA: formate dehydrogenase accessory protein FdhE [Luteibacter sp.]|uniref:formate dehydrogenase accessory protein FdhE n=1 Tax=Luteibacter sp. TaxID=1886636 RepID=UPI002C5F4704|nr:formate dehydrogenase accessory protein FdhE [Luteibacter sp.]HVI55959.1 formate dehydrogenase accessory protein FdhE [Luteibacter sp.]
MKQAEAPPDAAWSGPTHAGVKSPAPIVMPDLARRFAVTAARLDRLAAGHPMEPWLRFVARLARAQHAVASTLAPAASLEAGDIARATQARLPPLAADGHRRATAWRDGLTHLLDHLQQHAPPHSPHSPHSTRPPSPASPVGADSSAITAPDADLPPATLAAIDYLRHSSDAALESLADNFLRGHIPAADTGATVFVVAALQVYFTASAARLVADDLRLLEERSLCPCCGSPSVAGVITASGIIPGTRYLYCSMCSTAWNHTRAVCVTCGGTRHLSLQGIEGDPGLVKAETCADCHTYSKLLYQLRDTQVDPYADDLASFGLDLMVSEEGFARHAPNPWLLTGDSEEDIG